VTYKDIQPRLGAQAHVHVLKVCTSIFDKAGAVVGHAIANDTNMLAGIDFEKYTLYGTQRHGEYQQYALGNGNPSLRILASSVFGKNIQTMEHSSMQDAQATMELFVRRKDHFVPEAKAVRPGYSSSRNGATAVEIGTVPAEEEGQEEVQMQAQEDNSWEVNPADLSPNW